MSLKVAKTALLCVRRKLGNNTFTRSLVSKQLIYSQFGEPVQVVKLRECEVKPLKSQEVLVRMLAAPVNPADINTIQGRSRCLPLLPSVPGDEGVGDVVEIGNKVSTVEPGERVILTSNLLGTWRLYGIYHERDVHVISPNIPLPEASMVTNAPCLAYRMLRDFRKLNTGETVIINAANSPCGQCIIQFCKIWDLKTFCIVANNCGYETVKQHLQSIGASAVYTLQEAEEITSFNTSVTRPVLGLNCLGGKYEDVILRLLAKNGAVVYYGCAYELPMAKHYLRPDLQYYRFNLCQWNAYAGVIEKDIMMNNIIKLIAIGKFNAPMYEPIELKHFIHAFRNTVTCEAFAHFNFIFDFTVH